MLLPPPPPADVVSTGCNNKACNGDDDRLDDGVVEVGVRAAAGIEFKDADVTIVFVVGNDDNIPCDWTTKAGVVGVDDVAVLLLLLFSKLQRRLQLDDDVPSHIVVVVV